MTTTPSKKNSREEYEKKLNDNILNESLMGHPASEFDEGLELDYHEDSYSNQGISRVHSDEELEQVLKELLHNSHEFEGKDITVSVDNCNVNLRGTVKTQEERDYAESVVKLVHGVGEVRSEIIVKRNEGILPTDIGRHS